jgi:hypothetical protein
MKVAKGEGGGRYRLQAMVHMHYDNSLKDGMMDIKRQGDKDKIILVKLLIGDLVLNVISAYAPQIGLDEKIKRVLGRVEHIG